MSLPRACNILRMDNLVLLGGCQTQGAHNRREVATKKSPVLHNANGMRESLNLRGTHCFSSSEVKSLYNFAISCPVQTSIQNTHETHLSDKQIKKTRMHATKKFQVESKTMPCSRTCSFWKDQCKYESNTMTLPTRKCAVFWEVYEGYAATFGSAARRIRTSQWKGGYSGTSLSHHRSILGTRQDLSKFRMSSKLPSAADICRGLGWGLHGNMMTSV